MSNYLNGLRTTQVYSDLKRGVEDTIKRIPGRGERIVHQVKKTKSGIKQLFVPGMFFEDMGITYLGPVDGHDLKTLTKTLNEACLLYTSPSPRDGLLSRMPSSA